MKIMNCVQYNFPVKYVLPELISQEIISGGTFFTETYFGSHMFFPLSRPLGYINGIHSHWNSNNLTKHFIAKMIKMFSSKKFIA
jgi:hypothetical protein